MAENCKYNCGQSIPSSCVPFTGPDLTILVDVPEQDKLQCDANINDVIKSIDKAVKKLIDGNDFTILNPNDFDCVEFDEETVTAVELHQKELTLLCEHSAEIAGLSQQLADLNIGDETITIILPECLASDIAFCEQEENQYSLLSIITLFANKICEFETRISDLES